MASIREINGNLFWDFRYKGVRCREYTSLTDNKTNRTKMEKVLSKIDEEIASGTFEYRHYFPESKLAQKFENQPVATALLANAMIGALIPLVARTPLFKVFSEQWFREFSIGWRRSYKATVKQILDSRLLPKFGEKEVSSIRREDKRYAGSLLAVTQCSVIHNRSNRLHGGFQ